MSEIGDLRDDFIVAVSVLAGFSLILFLLIIILFFWVAGIRKRAVGGPSENLFTLQRPRLVKSNEKVEDYTARSTMERNQDLNPISRRNQASIDNSNFTFGNPDSFGNDMKFY